MSIARTSSPEAATTIVPMKPSPKATVTVQANAPSIDEFLVTAKRVLGTSITSQTTTTTRYSDVDLSSGGGEIIIRTTLPNGTQLEARRTLHRHSLKWRRIWPYVAFLMVLAAVLLVALHGNTIIEIAQKIFLELAR